MAVRPLYSHQEDNLSRKVKALIQQLEQAMAFSLLLLQCKQELRPPRRAVHQRTRTRRKVPNANNECTTVELRAGDTNLGDEDDS
jgi:hypothetical protein